MSKNNPEFELFHWTSAFFEKKENPTPRDMYKYRYLVYWGGRGSAKSMGLADLFLYLAYTSKQNIVCARKLKNDMSKSVYPLLISRIQHYGLESDFKITQNKIICKHNGSEFQFLGLDVNIDSIRSIHDITILWIEEAHFLNYVPWSIIRPSVRADNSRIVISMNPENENDCLYRNFINEKTRDLDGAYVCNLNWRDNPYFPPVLEDERQRDLRKNVDEYNHIWEGMLREVSDRQIFKGRWSIQEFTEPPKHLLHCYYGLDFGFNDPTAAIRCYIDNNVLYITHEMYDTQILPTEIGQRCKDEIPWFEDNLIIADSSRPDSIKIMENQGYNIQGSIKGKGSVEDGIQHIKSFDKIIIHERCKATIDEFKNYSYKVDPRSNQITRIIDDKSGHDHIIDALRYALEPVMKANGVTYNAFGVDMKLF